MISIYCILFFVVLTTANINNTYSIIRIYSNQAEIVRSLDKLPLEFNDDDWNNIRADSITLLGENINIISQIITEKKKTLNGTEIYIRSPISSDKTTIKLIKAILLDETTNLVKIQDESIADRQPLYFTVSRDQMFFLEEPVKDKYSVNFTYNTTASAVLVSYLQLNLNWQTQYQLNLYDNESDLIAMANIRNNGKSSISINEAELIAGDINFQVQQQQSDGLFRRKARLNGGSNRQFMSNTMELFSADTVLPTIEQGNELAGLYVFPIKESFTIDAKTNYLLPMFRPLVSVERYGLISKAFSTVSTNGKAQRSYRLRSDRYLSTGNCIIREQDRIVGETTIPNLAAKDKYEFSIGEDANIIYKENVTLISSTNFNETESKGETSSGKFIPSVVIFTRTRSVYEIKTEIKNFKDRQVNIEYEQNGFFNYRSLKLTKTTKDQFIQDGSSIKSNMTLKANMNAVYSFTIEVIY